ncbi:uncharacterized protein LOC142465631 [Ascaphus truei]|uniref:uncharacterized protein LOC142465631 n=1 Tax=Ascaphus truei TaxID=8439 RepID=UPI003F59A00C
MLQEHTREVQDKAAGIKVKVTALFGDLIEEMKVHEKRVLSEVIRQEEQVLLQVFGLIQQLEIEKDELSRKVLDIEKLCNITDPLTVLKGCESVREFCDIVEEEDSEEEDSEEEDSEEEDSDEQYADEQYADEQYADEYYADEYYADEQYADEQYADEQYAEEQYTEEQYADEFYADEYYAEEQHAEEQYVEEEDTQVQFLETEEADAEVEDTENIVKADNIGTGGSDLDEVLISLTLQKSLQSFAEDLPDITTKSGFHVPAMSDLLLSSSTSRDYVAVSENQKTVSRTGKQATNR